MRSNQTYPTMAEMEALWETTLRPQLLVIREEKFSLLVYWNSLSQQQQKVFSVMAILAVFALGSLRSGNFIVALASLLVPGAFLLPLLGGKIPRLERYSKSKHLINTAAADAWGLTYSPTIPNDYPSNDQTDGWHGTFEAFRQERLIPEFSSEKREDYISGERYGTHFECFETELKYKVRDSERVIFRGILLRLSWPTSIKDGKVIFVPPMSSEFHRLLLNSKIKRYRPTDPSLDKRLGFFTSDPVLGLATLTADKMERMESVAAKFNLRKMRGMVRGDSLFLAFEMYDRFEHGAERKAAADPAAFYSTLNDMMFVCELVRELSGVPAVLTEPSAKSA